MAKLTHPCVDMHVHLGNSFDGGRLSSVMIKKMMRQGPASHAVVFAIDDKNPGPSYRRLNRQVAALVKKNKRIMGFARLDPKEPQAAFEEIKRAVSQGLRGFKFHGRSDHFRCKEAIPLIAEIEKQAMPVMIHTSHERECRPRDWQQICLRHKRISFILAHAGKDKYLEAADVAVSCRNVFLDTSTLSYFRTGMLLKKAGSRNLVFASDAPYSHPDIEFLKWGLLLKDKRKAMRDVFYENAKRILGGLDL